MPLFSRRTRSPLFNSTAGNFEDRASFQRRLDSEDHAEDRDRVRLRPKNRLGPKKFGIEITFRSPRHRKGDTYRQYYRTERARRAGLAHYNGPKNRVFEVIGSEARWTARAI